MPEIEAQLRDHAAWLSTTRGELDPVALRARAGLALDDVVPAPSSHRARRHRLAVVAAAIMLLAGLLGGATILNRRGAQELDVTHPPAASAPAWTVLPGLTFDGTWIGTDAPPVWTGTEVLLVGAVGQGDANTKVPAVGSSPAFNPATKTWRMIAPPPGDLAAGSIVASWTGTRVVVLGTPREASGPDAHAAGASYDPKTDTWTPLRPAPPGRGVGGPMAWTGDRFLMWSLGIGVTAYTPATDTWEVLTDDRPPAGADPSTASGLGGPRMNSSTATAVWTGTELVVADGGSSAVAAIDPATRRWRELPTREGAGGGRNSLVWTGRYLALGDVRGPAWIEPHGTAWSISRGPASAFPLGPGASVWLGNRFVAWGDPPYADNPGAAPVSHHDGAMLDLATSTWSTVSNPPAGPAAFAQGTVLGDEIFTWGVDDGPPHTPGHGTIHAAIVSVTTLTAPGATGAASPGDAPLPRPAGVEPTELAEASYGFSTEDPSWQFGPYRREDSTANVLTKQEAYAAALRNADMFGVGATPSAEAKLGHLLQGVGGTSPPKDTLAWKLSFEGVPGPSRIEGPICAPAQQTCEPVPGATMGSVTVVVDARTGVLLLLQHLSPTGG